MTYASARAVEVYKKSKIFEDEDIEGSYDAYQLGFTKCKKKVIEALLGLNLDGIIDVKPEEKGKEEEEGEVMKVEECFKGVMYIEANWVVIENTIAEVMAKAKAMIEAVVKAFNIG